MIVPPLSFWGQLALGELGANSSWYDRYELERSRRSDAEGAVERLVTALEGTKVGVWNYDVPTGDIWLSDTLIGIQGYTRAEAERLPHYPHMFLTASADHPSSAHPDDRAAIAQMRLDILIGARDAFEIEHRMLHRDGHWIWISQRFRVVSRDENNLPLRVVGIRSDITEQKHIEEQALQALAELNEAKTRLELASEAANIGIFTWDYELEFMQFSPTAKELFGLDLDRDPTRDDLRKVIHPDDARGIAEHFAALPRAHPWRRYSTEFRALTPDGSTKWLYIAGARTMPNAPLVYGIVLDITKRKQAEQSLAVAQQELVETQVRALRYQVNPHFLFNTLNSVATLVVDGDPSLAEQMVLKLAAFYRASLQRDPLQQVSLAEEIHLLQLFLDIEMVRFPEVQPAFDIGAGASDALVPCLILQPLIENAIKYGLRSAGTPLNVRVSARVRGGRLQIEVDDDGRGSKNPGKGGTGTGLSVTAQRLKMAYGGDFDFMSGPKQNEGYRVTLDIPYIIEKA